LKSKVFAEPRLIGRERELKELHQYLRLAIEGKGTTVFISGEAGAGKTRFVNEFLSSAKHKRETTMLAGWCLSNAAVPYFPFIEAFNAYFAAKKSEENEAKQTENEETETKAWLMGLKQAEKTGKLSPQAWKDLTFAAVTKALLSIAAKKPTILFIDDLHWADSASLALLHYISRAIASERVLVIATFRSEELSPDTEGQPHPLVEAMRLMRRENLFKEIKLLNLNKTAVSALAENMIGGMISPELAENLAEESQGNPLFIVESLRMLAENESLVQDFGQWRLSVDKLGIPTKIKDIILRRVGVLKPNQRRILELASVIGEKFNVELLGAVLEQDILQVLETLNSVAQSSSLVVCEGDFYRFDHVKSREAIYEEISSPLRKGYHARVAEQLEASSKDARKISASDLAYHYAQAGNKEKAVKNALAAGQDALERFSNTEAIQHFGYVLTTVSDAQQYAKVRLIALEGLGDAYTANCMFKEAIVTYERLSDSGSGKLRLRALRKAMDAIFHQRGDPAHLMELARKAEDYAALDRLESARVRLSRGRVFVMLGNYTSALEDFEGALQVFEEEYSLPDAALALIGVGAISSMINLEEKGLGALCRAIAIYEELGDVHNLIDAINMLGGSFGRMGLVEESYGIYSKLLKIAQKAGNYNGMFNASLVLSRLKEHLECFEEAVALSLKAAEYFKKTDTNFPQEAIFENLVRQYAKMGDLEHAQEYYRKLLKLPQKDSELSGIVFFRALQPVNTKAIFFAAKKQWKKAQHYFEKGFEMIRKGRAGRMYLMKNYAWALEKEGRTEEAKIQLKEIQRIKREVEKRFAHTNIQANLMTPRKVVAHQEFEMRLDLVSIAKKPGSLIKIEGLIPPEFKVDTLPTYCSLDGGSINMNKKSMDPFQVETVKLRLKAPNPGAFSLNPKVTYMDEKGENKTCSSNSVTITVQPAQPQYEVLPGRITTGFAELDGLLLGGIPEKYAVVLSSPSSDERELLIKRFLEGGANAGETTFHITVEAANAKALAEKYPSNFYLFICNPQADAMIRSLPNVFKLKGVENLTEIDIALTKAFRTLSPSVIGGKRVCLEIVSDVLLQHHAVITRKWLSAFLPNLKSKGFTILAVVNPHMHPQEEVQAILGLFEGEMRIFEKETAKGREKVLQILRLHNQKYLESELALTKEKME